MTKHREPLRTTRYARSHRPRGAVVVGLVVALAAAAPATSFACPDCATARAARASVLGDGFARHLAEALAPFLLMGALSAAAYRRA